MYYISDLFLHDSSRIRNNFFILLFLITSFINIFNIINIYFPGNLSIYKFVCLVIIYCCKILFFDEIKQYDNSTIYNNYKSKKKLSKRCIMKCII